MTLAAAQVHVHTQTPRVWAKSANDWIRIRNGIKERSAHASAHTWAILLSRQQLKNVYVHALFSLESIIICGHRKEEKKGLLVYLCLCVCVHVYFSLIKFGKQKLQANEIIHLARFANEMNVREHTPRARERKWRKNRNSSNNKNVVARKRTERILLFLFFAD